MSRPLLNFIPANNETRNIEMLESWDAIAEHSLIPSFVFQNNYKGLSGLRE
jgi:hypothetical protein